MTRMTKALALVLVLAVGAGAAAIRAQIVVTQDRGGALQVGPPDTRPLEIGTGIIFGRALEAGTTRPVGGAIVTLVQPGAAPVRVMADAQGQFGFRDLPAGRFTLTATRPGYADGAYGRLRPGGAGQAVDLAAGQHVADANVSLWKFAAITGRVIDDSGDPIVGANVRVLKRTTVAGKRQLSPGPTDRTDDRGVYRIGSLEPGDYVVVVPMTQSNRDSLLQSLGVGRDLLAALPAGGGGGGAVMFSARVDSGGGVTTISLDGADSEAMAAGVSPDGRPLVYQTEFYPSSVSASRATPITLGSGDERGGIDFQMRGVRAVTVSGTVSSPDGQPSDLSLSLIPADADDLVTPIETAMTTTDANGAFKFSNVPPGQYTLRSLRTPRSALPPGATTTVVQGGDAMRMVTSRTVVANNGPAPPLPTAPTLWAEMNLSVGTTDLPDVAVALRPGAKISGRVDFAGAAARPEGDQLSSIQMSLEPADGRTSGLTGTVRGRVDATGQFTTMGVPAGKYVLRVTPPRGWALRGAAFNGQDIVDTAIDLREADASGVVITFTDRSGDLGGTVTSSSGSPDATATVLLFPVDRELWSNAGSSPRRLKTTRAGKDGSYSFSGLPAGDYSVVAVPEAATAEWQSPENLDALARGATRVHVEEGDKRTQALQTVRR